MRGIKTIWSVGLFDGRGMLYCRLAASGNSDAVVLTLQEQLHEKELRLTDVQLEALSSAHQLQQMQDTINRMKVGIMLLHPHACTDKCNYLKTTPLTPDTGLAQA